MTPVEMHATGGSSQLTIPRVVKLNTMLISLVQAASGAGLQLIPTLGALMIVRLLGSATWVGLAGSILGVSRLVIAYPVGALTDARGRKPGLYVGLILSMAGSVLAGLSMLFSSLLLFVIGIFVFGLGAGAVQQLRVAAADMYPPRRRAEGLGYVLTGSLAGAFGSTALVSVAKEAGDGLSVDPLMLSWLLVPVLLLPCLYLVYRVRPDPLEIARTLQRYYPGLVEPLSENPEGVTGTGFWVFVRHYPKLVAFASNFAAQGNMVMIMAITALVLDHHGHGLSSISLSVSIHVLGMFGLSLPLGKVADVIGRKPVLLAGAVISGGGSLLVALTSEYGIITAGAFLVGVGWSFINVASTAVLSDTTNAGERGRAIGASDAFGGVSNIMMPLAVGPIAEGLGMAAVGLTGALLMAMPFLMLLWLNETSPGHYAAAAPLEPNPQPAH